LRGVPSQAPGGLALDVQPLLHLSYSEISPLAAFLHALTGEVPQITPPELP
jgi:hypothetical protein